MYYVRKVKAWYNRPKSKFLQYFESLLIFIPLAFIIRTYFYGLYQVPTGSMETTMLVGDRFFADKFTILFSQPKYGDVIAFNDPNYHYSDNYWINLFERYVYGPSNWTKRVIGCPGDHIKGVIENGEPVVYRNEQRLEEPYLNKYPLINVYYDSCGIIPRSYDPNFAYDQQPFYYMNSEYVALAKAFCERQNIPWMLKPHTPAYDKYGRNVDEFDVHLGANQYWVMGDNRLGSLDSRYWGPLDGTLIHGKIVLMLFSIDSEQQWMILDLVLHPIDFFFKKIRWNRFLRFVH